MTRIDLDKCRESAGWLAMKGHMHEAKLLRAAADELAALRETVAIQAHAIDLVAKNSREIPMTSELEALRKVAEAGQLLPLVLTTPDHELTGRELLFREALAAWRGGSK